MFGASVRKRSVVVFTAVAGASMSCGGGGEGEPAPVLHSDVLGDGRSLSSLVDPSVMPRPAANESVDVTGAQVTFIDTFDETRDGKSAGHVYMQTLTKNPAPFQGIFAFSPVFSPPSLRIAVGDVIDVTGPYQEYTPAGASGSGVMVGPTPEFSKPTIVRRFDAVGNTLTPVTVKLSDLISYDTGLPWMSMLVRLENVTVAATAYTTDSAGHRANITLSPGMGGVTASAFPHIDNELFDIASIGTKVTMITGGTVIKSVTGIVTYFEGTFSIAPRSATDLVF